MRLLFCLLLATLAPAADLSAVGGGGFSAGEEQHRVRHWAAGVAARASHFQFDYLRAGRHFLTGSYVREGQTGRARPFFHIGAGAVVERGDTSLAVVFGAGATIDLRRSLFLRPQVRLYGYVGLTFMVVPSIGIGWRF